MALSRPLELEDRITINLLSRGYNRYVKVYGPAKGIHAFVYDTIELIEKGYKVEIPNMDVFIGIRDIVLVLNKLAQTDINVPPLPNAVEFFLQYETKTLKEINKKLDKSPYNKLSLDRFKDDANKPDITETVHDDIDSMDPFLHKFLLRKIDPTHTLLDNPGQVIGSAKHRLIMTDEMKKLEKIKNTKRRHVEFKLKKDSGIFDAKVDSVNSSELDEDINFIIDD